MSYSAVRADGRAVAPAIGASVDQRLDFIRKVYLTMFSGLVVFAATMAGMVIGAAAQIPVLSEAAALAIQIPPIVSFIVLIASSFLVHSLAMVRVVNLVAMYFFAALWGFITFPLVLFAIAVAGVEVVFQALGLTTLVFGGLTGYVFITRKDFSFMGGFLFVGLMMLIGAALIAMIAGMMGYQLSFVSTGLAIVSTLLFMGYVLYDTSNVLNHYSTDMVVPAALALMVDFIILFRNILYLLLASRN